MMHSAAETGQRRRALFACAATVIAACGGGSDDTSERVVWIQETCDINERRIPAVFDLLVGPASRLDGLAQAEVIYDGPYVDDLGHSYVTVRTTGHHAQQLAREWGFTARTHRRAVPLGPFGEISAHASLCTSCAPSSSSLLKDYGDIVNELEAMAASDPAIRTFSIGNTHTNEREIVAIQFGPTLPSQTPPPTVFVLGTHHAREWMSTGVTLAHARWLLDVITKDSDPEMLKLLERAAIVIIPVANPDGYQHTRDPNGERCWRGNRDLSCGAGSQGVNLNRNLTTTFLKPSFHQGSCQSENWPGSALAAENEALEALFTSDAETHEIAAVLSYHAFADTVLYPTGYNPVGPECQLTSQNQCYNPDFTLYRDVFGDTHSGTWIDRESAPSTHYPYFRDHTAALLYGVSGDTGLGVNYSPTFSALSATVELPSTKWGFSVECESDPDALIESSATEQRSALRRLVSAAPGLVANAAADAWGPTHVGTMASGLWTREYDAVRPQSVVRSRFVKSVWGPADTGDLTANIGTQQYAYTFGRSGAEYNLYFLDQGPTFDSLTIPCEIVSSSEAGSSIDSAPECEQEIDLCDATRLPSSGFTLRKEDRGGARDCWWEASSNSELTIPGGVPRHLDTTHCHATFTLEWLTLLGSVVIERDSGQDWETVYIVNATANDAQAPYFDQGHPFSGRLHSYSFESNADLPLTAQSFRIRLIGNAEYLRVFDPVIFCRSGGLP